MVNYAEGKIYMIYDKDVEKRYIGSTVDTLEKRLAFHVAHYKSHLKGKHNYVSSFDIIKDGNYDIWLVEAFPCETKAQLVARERYWSNQMACVNKCKNQGLYNEMGNKNYHKHYYTENKDALTEQMKQYYNTHKEIITQKKKVKTQCSCGGCYTKVNKSKHIKSKKHANHKPVVDVAVV